MLNEAPLPRDRWGSPEPVDPGQYEVRASGEGLQPWSSTFLVDAQHDAVVVVPGDGARSTRISGLGRRCLWC